MDELAKAMKIAYSTEFSFFIKAHFYHVNVEGPDFDQYHNLFGKIYEEIYSSIDPFAENIRKLGTYTPGSFTRFSMLSQIDDELTVPPALDMINDLLNDSEKCIKIFKMVYDLSEREGEVGLSDFLANRISAHKKHSWMLKATLNERV